MAQGKTKYIDYLSEDTPIPGQLWVCMSFLSPEGIKNCSVRGVKIRGVYGTKQEADLRAEELQKLDGDFHVFVGEMGKWLPWDPDPNDVQDQIYQEKELNDLMKGYKENLSKAKQMQQDRKKEMIQNAAREEQAKASAPTSSAKKRLRKRLAAKKQQNKMDALAERSIESELQENETIIKTEKEKIDQTNAEIRETTENLESIESKLAKIQQLYESLNK